MTSPTYVYNLACVHRFNPDHLSVDRVDRVGAYHASDVPFWFGTLESFNLFRPTRLWTSDDWALSAQMTAALIAFANTGNPTTTEISWPAWTPEREQFIEIGERLVAIKRMSTARLEFMAHPTP